MKPLVAVISCHANEEYRQAQLNTWIGTWGDLIDVRFFLGKPIQENTPNTFYFDVEDTFFDLPFKVQSALEWAHKNEYTHVFKCDDDTYINVPRLLSCGFEEHDYMGNMAGVWWECYAQGGAGYWLGPKSLNILHKEGVYKESFRFNWAEDSSIGAILQAAGVRLKDDRRFFHGTTEKWGFPTPSNDIITSHKCPPWRMRNIHSIMIR